MSADSQPGIGRSALILRVAALMAVAVGAGFLAVDWFRPPAPPAPPMSPPAPAVTPIVAGKPLLVRHRPAQSSATIATEPPPPASVHPTIENGREYRPVSFRKLAGFPCPANADGTTPLPADLIPPDIRALNGQFVEVIGFMVPIETEGTNIKSFALVKNRMLCCFGVIPKLNEWIFVHMREGAAAGYYPDQPVRVLGRLTVGSDAGGEGITGIYRMEGDNLYSPRRPSPAGQSAGG
jgi:hypothetical protein